MQTSPVGCGERVVQPGEGISSIALETGFFWSTIWNDPANAALREARPNPEVLLPGDRITIPTLRPKRVACATGQRHVFRRRGVPSKIAFQVRSRDAVFAGCRYVLQAGAEVHEGTTGSDGSLCHFVSPALRRAELTVWLATEGYPETATWTLNVGYLDPPNTLRGVQSRLANLGYAIGDEYGTQGPLTTGAITAVQQTSGLTVNGILDDATYAAIEQLHGS